MSWMIRIIEYSILTLYQAINQEMHLCKQAEEDQKQVDDNKEYRLDTRGRRSSRWQECQRENQFEDRGLGPQDPRLSNPAKMRKKCYYGQEKNLG